MCANMQTLRHEVKIPRNAAEERSKVWATDKWPLIGGDSGVPSDCWHCCFPFDNMPYPMPVKYDDKLKVFTFKGCFCSWGCAKGYISETSKYGTDSMALIAYLMKVVHGSFTSSSKCRPAPSRTRLTKFGGDLSIDKFREYSTQDSDKLPGLDRTMLPNVFHKEVPIQEYIVHDRVERPGKKIVGTEAVIDEPLRIRRKGPDRKHTNTLSKLVEKN